MYILCNRTIKFDVVTHVGEGRVSRGQPHLPSQESGVPVLPNIWVSPVLPFKEVMFSSALVCLFVSRIMQ